MMDKEPLSRASKKSALSPKELRGQAEERLKRKTAEGGQSITNPSAELLIRELEVHQLELEIQNEELRNTQGELEKALERFSDLYEFAPAGFFTLDKAGNIVETNLRGAAMLNAERQRLMGTPFLRYLAPESQTTFHRFMDDLVASQEKRTCELQFLKDGTAPVDTMVEGVVRTDAEKSSLEISLNAIDITERKLTEEALRNAQRLDSLGVLAGGIAHDLNNYLFGIWGNIELANLNLSRNKPETAKENLLNALPAFNNTKNLTQQLLTFSKGGAPIKKMTALPRLIRESALFTLSGSNVTCEFDLPEHLWPCNVDASQLGQGISNLIINAQQAMPAGGRIRINAENISDTSSPPPSLAPGNYVRFSIKDHGQGIARDHLSKIFNPFFTTKPKGNGLGLTITYSIIHKHGGCITVQSDVGNGSVFSIFLPAAPAVLQPTAPEIPSGPIKGRGRILVIDDNETISRLLGSMLTELGYTPEIAADGCAAIGLYKKRQSEGLPFDAVIFDLTIPGGMGGTETLSVLKELNPGIKAIASSGYSNNQVMSNPTEFGFMATLVKPYTADQLSVKLNEVLSSNAKP